jgi:hypothetical protein
MASILPFPSRPLPDDRADDALAALALADDARTLDPAHPVNAALAEVGAGSVPRLLGVDARRRVATLACVSIGARLDLPLGWHAIEDARHVALFDPGRQVQVQIGLLARAGMPPAALLDALEGEAGGAFPAPDALRLRERDLHLLAMRRGRTDRVPQEEYHLLGPGSDEDTWVHVRAVAAPVRGGEAALLAEALYRALAFGSRAEAADATNETQRGLR